MGDQRSYENEPDMEQRDPNDLNAHIKVAFEDVFGEPEATHSMDCVWRNAYKCFNCGKNCCYKFLTTICGLCIALFWGCNFAWTAFDHIWCFTPLMRDFSICVGCWQRAFATVVNCCVVPCCSACGHCFSNINVRNS